MKVAIFCAFLLGASSGAAVTPIQKVITMLTEMKAKGTKEMENEASAFEEYKTFCKETSWDKSVSIKDAKAAIDQLSADIGMAESDVATAVDAIASLNSDLTKWGDDVKTNKRMRKDSRAVFSEVHQDLTESIDAVERALTTLKSGSAPSSMLAQTSLLELSDKEAKHVITSFLQEVQPMNALIQDAEGEEQPQASVENYSSSSGTVIDMVENLGEKFEDERSALEKKEANEKHTYDMMMQDLTNQISHATEERDSKTAFKAKRAEDKASAEGDLADTKAALAADQKYLTDLVTECETKSADFAARQKLRSEELEAIQQATDIMSSDTVAGSGEKHLPQLLQKGTSLAQMRGQALSPVQRAVEVFLKDKARKTDSRVLSLIATKIGADPFSKVVKMIQDMIVKLTEEANEEAEHKGWCDSELGSNKQTRDSKTEESDMLKSTIEELTADVSKLAQEITDLSAAIQSIDAAVAKATGLRAAEKEKNTETIADAAAGKAAVSQAVSVLKSFYDKASVATALVQQSKPYTGMGGGGVLGMLEVCLSDFQRLESDTTTGEAESARVYEQFMTDSASDKAAKEEDVKHKDGTKQTKESALATAKRDLAAVTEELSAAMKYYEKLKPSCLSSGESYEERTARRKDEIESLKEALNILNGDNV